MEQTKFPCMKAFSYDFVPRCSQHVPGVSCFRNYTGPILLILKRSGHCATKHFSSGYTDFIPNIKRRNHSFHRVVNSRYGTMNASHSHRLNSKDLQSSRLLIQRIDKECPTLSFTESQGYSIYQLKRRVSIINASPTISIQHRNNYLCPLIFVVLDWLHNSSLIYTGCA